MQTRQGQLGTSRLVPAVGPSSALRRVTWLNRRTIVACTLLVALLLSFATYLKPTPKKQELEYQGKPIKEWVGEWLERQQSGHSMSEHSPEIQTLRSIGSDVIPYLAEATKPHYIRERVWHVLGRISYRIPRFLYGDTDPTHTRIRAYQTLRCIGPLATNALPELMERFQDEHDLIEFAANTLQSLGQYRPHAEEVLTFFRQRFRNTDQRDWFYASIVLMGLETNTADLVASLTMDALSANRRRCRNACYLLGRMGSKAASALPALTNATQRAITQDIARDAIARIVSPNP